MDDDKRIRFTTTVYAEEAHKFPDMRLRLLIRQAWLDSTKDTLTQDEALQILEDEVTYLQARMKP